MVVGPLTAFRRRSPEVPDLGAWLLRWARTWRDHALAERERWPLWLPVGFGTGIGLYFAMPFEPSVVVGAVLGIVGITSAIFASRATNIGLRVCFAALTAISLGF